VRQCAAVGSRGERGRQTVYDWRKNPAFESRYTEVIEDALDLLD
jgi:hypothetical protein